MREVSTAWKKENPTRVQDYNLQRYTAGSKLIMSHLQANPCVDCGENDPIVLEFDHIEPAQKYRTISNMKSYPVDKIQSEIAKCEVRCANCHRRKTAIQFGWYRNLICEEPE